MCMRHGSVLIPFFLCVSTAFAADPPLSIRTLDGKTVTGEMTGITDREVTLKVEGKPVATRLESVVQIDFQPMPVGGPSKEAFTGVGLTDGSVLRCAKFGIKGKEATVTLAGGPEFTVPLAAVSYVMHEANNEPLAKQFREYLAKSKKQ